jgi:hypothetical protein
MTDVRMTVILSSFLTAFFVFIAFPSRLSYNIVPGGGAKGGQFTPEIVDLAQVNLVR